MAAFLARMGAAVCHRMAARSFIWGEGTMPLCARCTGLYIGVFLAFCFFFCKRRMAAGKPFSKGQAMLTAGMILPIGVDGVGSYLGFWQSSQCMRVLSGSLVGAVVPGFLLLAVNFNPTQKNEMPIYEKTTELLLLLAVSAGLGIALWLGLPLKGLLVVFSVMGEILLWGGFVWLILKTLLGKKSIPFWRISLAVAFFGLYAIGGLVQ